MAIASSFRGSTGGFGIEVLWKMFLFLPFSGVFFLGARNGGLFGGVFGFLCWYCLFSGG